MPYAFTSAQNHSYNAGHFFLGLDPETGQEVGIPSERHAITIAGAGSGKGAAVIIPNLLRWPHNALVVDPKGENAERTWEAREALGQRVYVLDPFKVANVPDRLRSGCNLLASIKPDSPTAREDIRVIADGLVMRFKAEDSTWDNGAVSVLSGMIAYVCDDPEPSGRNLHNVRRNLTLPPDTLKEVFEDMATNDAYGGLCRGAAAIGLSDSRKNREFVGGAVDHSEWLDSPAMVSILTGDGFNLSELKTGKATVYLVLPPQYLGEHGRFLRVFVRAALDAMAKGLKGERCLFLLDEFFALGRIDEIAKAAGLMRGYGVQLWPFLQDLGQLVALYGKEGAETFFGNADVHAYFGNTDSLTLNHVSDRLGRKTLADIGVEPPPMATATVSRSEAAYAYGSTLPPQSAPIDAKNNAFRMFQHIGQSLARVAHDTDMQDRAAARTKLEERHKQVAADDATAMRRYQHAVSERGEPRFTPEQVRELVAKHDGDAVARSMIVFAKGGHVLNLKLAPYFLPRPLPNEKNAVPQNPSTVAPQAPVGFWRRQLLLHEKPALIGLALGLAWGIAMIPSVQAHESALLGVWVMAGLGYGAGEIFARIRRLFIRN